MSVECERTEREGGRAGNFGVALQREPGRVVRDKVGPLNRGPLRFNGPSREVKRMVIELERGGVVQHQRSRNRELVLQLQQGTAHVQSACACDAAPGVQAQGGVVAVERFVVRNRQAFSHDQFGHGGRQTQGMAVKPQVRQVEHAVAGQRGIAVQPQGGGVVQLELPGTQRQITCQLERGRTEGQRKVVGTGPTSQNQGSVADPQDAVGGQRLGKVQCSLPERKLPLVQRSGSGNAQAQVFGTQRMAIELEGRGGKSRVVAP